MKNTKSKPLESNVISTRHGNHATIYGLRRDPKLADKSITKNSGENKLPFVSGSTYRGEWFDNKKSGFGMQINQDGSKYEGEFRENLYHGSGSMWIRKDQKNVKEYTGNWKNGKRSGIGSLCFENGDVYMGEWLANKRSGEGRLDYANGDYFIGQWHNDIQKGYGKMYCKNGNIFEGLYHDGMKSGPGLYFYAATRKVYEGEWLSDAPRCGEYREPSVEEEIRFKEPMTVIRRFELPMLGLLDAQSIVDTARTESRVLNGASKALEVTHIHSESTSPLPNTLSEGNISRAAVAFSALDSSEDGLLPLKALRPVFLALGSDFSTDDVVGHCDGA